MIYKRRNEECLDVVIVGNLALNKTLSIGNMEFVISVRILINVTKNQGIGD